MGSVAGPCGCVQSLKRFWGSLKHEWLLYAPQPTRAGMKQDVADYIRYYNLDSGHPSNGGMSPVRYEQLSFRKVSGFA
ncbi:IS3 family transposase [Salmonella enterica]|uniref:Integrase catalytic domain-containing protein n=1 Tax=Salmonella enterica subsp. enterica serovar Rough O:d:1,7 TaxID=1974323 RepID=A0A974KCV2_SALET|nr:hypothetical protein [Salmonella enterica subsp. enterica serovar Florida]EIP3425931.1 IS3 family transposase [Salmonella enterica]OSD64250.1 hypothetical protein R537_24025 [Salmonella enterica subsp. enterica serovar Rough O:d:1,7]ECF4168039.1 hypothetical protein [Salmonella enterica subsp. enterica serovar Florida]ECW2476705.1 hypothetical protein [Salmonella enterica subsp. enterica serovar Florida]